MTIAPPPEYVVVPYEYLEQAYKPDKPRRALFATFVRILALAWQSKYKQTPPMTDEELIEFLKLSRRQYYEQKADMELLGWLRSSHPAPGFVQFTFSRSITPADPASAENRTQVQKTAPLIGGEESLINLNTDSLPPLKEKTSAENRTFPTVKEILKHSDKLFDGSVVTSKGIEDRSPLEALAWCAYAYHVKGKVDGAAGIVRNRLKDYEPAPLWATEQWPEVLPTSFLEVLGLVTYVCDVCQAKFKQLAELEAHERTHPKVYACGACELSFTSEEDLDAHYDQAHRIRPDESVSLPIREGSSLTPEQAWQSVLSRLQMEMPRASFDSWVRDTRAICYGRNTLTIGVRNPYARDWLESRLASTVSRLLVGIMNDGSVAVEFVTAARNEVG